MSCSSPNQEENFISSCIQFCAMSASLLVLLCDCETKNQPASVPGHPGQPDQANLLLPGHQPDSVRGHPGQLDQAKHLLPGHSASKSVDSASSPPSELTSHLVSDFSTPFHQAAHFSNKMALLQVWNQLAVNLGLIFCNWPEFRSPSE